MYGGSFQHYKTQRASRILEDVRKLVRYLWALPNTVLGGFLCLAAFPRGRVAIVDGVVEAHGPMLRWALRRLPIVDADLDDMRGTDFRPFVALRDASPWAMVAHLVFTRLDREHPASVSPLVCDFIRRELGYDGVIITDCLTMEALSGTWPERVTAALDAGYDIALHSQGDLAASQAADRAALARIRAIDRNALSPADQLNYDTFLWQQERAVEQQKFHLDARILCGELRDDRRDAHTAVHDRRGQTQAPLRLHPSC